MQGSQGKKVLASSVESASRLARDKSAVGRNVTAATAQHHVDRLTKPGSLSGSMKKAGIALIATPDPFTGVPGVALLASSFVMKKKEPATLGNLAMETRKILREIQSLSL
ncbi:MAG: hypothetical protein HY297_05095 [Thaumarchaeota archaeon]|nr:hypothetical protein [Nitrososphaerota archaeon]